MMALWMTYAVLVGGLVTLGALAIERALRVARLPARWIWAAAIPLSIGVAMRAPAPETSPGVAIAVTTPRPSVEPSKAPAWRAILGARLERAAEWLDVSRSLQTLGASAVARVDDRLAAAVWLVLTTGLGLVFLCVHTRFVSARRRWPRADLHGETVHISSHVGPAAIGVVSPRIVIPQWLLARPESDQRLALAHESEHLRARDPQLLAAACLAVVLFPWNPALWMIVARLRLAIEVDCDRRVLRRGTPAAVYGSLLVSVAELATPLRPSALALADDSSHLKTRILAMDTRSLRLGRTRAALATLAGTVAVLAACHAKEPTAADVDALSGASAERTAREIGVLHPVDTAVVYKVDGASVSAEQAHAIPASEIASMSVGRGKGSEKLVAIATLPKTISRTRSAGDSNLVETVSSRAVAAHGGVPLETKKVESDTAIVWFVNGVRADYSVFRTLNRDDIESVEVLKGAAAAQAFDVPLGKAVVSIKLKKGG